ncbi:MAG: DNA starvation/stationary phase protection protein, partial [Planctomycetota bacterium]
FHWNVTGPMFSTLHLLFETQYTELALAVDEIAERIRSIGHVAPGTYKQFAELSSVQEPDGIPKATEMIRILADDQRVVAESARKLIGIAEEAGDQATADLMTRRVDIHEKNAWMLEAHLE